MTFKIVIFLLVSDSIPLTRNTVLFPQLLYTLNKDYIFHTLNKGRSIGKDLLQHPASQGTKEA